MTTPPNPEEAIVDAALEMPAHERAAYLDKLCGNDHQLRQLVDALLHAHKKIISSQVVPPRDPSAAPTQSDSAPGEGAPERRVPGVTTMAVSVTPIEKPGDHIGRYKLLQQIGEGGGGIVYMAEQVEPVRRRVALKILKLGMDTKQVIARFEAERQALALMDHPNIAKVHDAGATETGRPYFVMELVRGIKITDYCDQNNLSTETRLDLFIQTCKAVQHAHQKGIIHRDIKPSNILVTLHDGVPVPKVIDFGIAKATTGQPLTDKTVFTAFEQFIGTPAYMSPEQAEMSSLDIDTRSDIYSLGVLLYELLTGQMPFDPRELAASGFEEMRRIIRTEDPLRPSTRLSNLNAADQTTVAKCRQVEAAKLIHLVRGDLDWIVMKCLEKDRTRRYDTANGLATDVQRYLNTEPVMARPPSQLYRLQKLVRRNKLAFGAVSAVAAALVIGLGLSTWLFIKERGTRHRAETAEREQARQRHQAEAAQASESHMRKEAEAQTLAARRKAYASDMSLLQQALARDDLGRAQQLLERQRPLPGQQDLRGWEWRYFWQFCQSDAAFTLCQRSDSIMSVSFSSTGNLLAVATFSGEVTVWELPSRRMIFQHAVGKPNFANPGDRQAYTCFGRGKVAFAPEGDLLAYYDGEKAQKVIVLWDARQRAEMRRLPLNDPPRDFAFTRDGRLFTAGTTTSDYETAMTAAGSNNITAWDVHSGAVVTSLSVPILAYGLGSVFNVTSDGKKFAYKAEGALEVRVQDVMARTVSIFKVPGERTVSLAFSLDGQILATGEGYATGTIRLWDVHNQSLGSLEGHRAWVTCMKALPDGVTIASASADRTIRLWNLKTRKSIRTLRGHYGELYTLDASADGRWLATGSKDGTVHLWDLAASTNLPAAYRTIERTSRLQELAYSPDGRLIGCLWNGHLVLCQASTPDKVETELPWTNILAFAFAPDSGRLAAMDNTGYLSLWDIPGQRVITNFTAQGGTYPLGFMADGHRLLTCNESGMTTEWDSATWREIQHFQLDPKAMFRAISPQGGLVATANLDEVEIVSTRSPHKRLHFVAQPRVNDLKFSPDGKTLATASDSGTVELWDTATGTRTAALRGVLLGFHSVAFSPNGERLAAGSNGQEAIKMWDMHSLEEVATLPGPGSIFSATQFSPDGNTILSRNSTFWRAPGWAEIQAAERARRSTAPP